MQDGLHGPVYGDFLVVAEWLGVVGIRWGEQLLRCGVVQVFGGPQPLPQVVGGGKLGDRALDARGVVSLNDAFTVGGVGELQAQHLGVLPSLLQALGSMLVARLGFDHGDGEVGTVAQQVIGAFLLSAAGRATGEKNPPLGKGALLVDGVRRVIPARGLKLGNDEFAAGIGFVQWHAISSDRTSSILISTIRDAAPVSSA